MAFEGRGQDRSTAAIISIGAATAGVVVTAFCGFGLVLSVVAMVFGFLGRKEVRDSGGALAGERMATAGIVIGALTILASVLLIFVVLQRGG
jgi:Domain of unknown function (DUF4190)